MASNPLPLVSPAAAELLAATPLLDHASPAIQQLIARRGWLALEGYILDQPYLQMLQDSFIQLSGRFCGYGVAVDDLQLANTDWCGEETYIQRGAISADLGLFAAPDLFYQRHGTNLSGARRWLYQHAIRHWMNRKVQQIRSGRLSRGPLGC